MDGGGGDAAPGTAVLGQGGQAQLHDKLLLTFEVGDRGGYCSDAAHASKGACEGAGALWTVRAPAVAFRATGAPGTCFLAIGFPDPAGHAMSDMDVVWVSTAGSAPSIEDRYVNGYNKPKVDTQQDLKGEEVTYEDGVLAATWWRYQASQDSAETLPILDRAHCIVARLVAGILILEQCSANP